MKALELIKSIAKNATVLETVADGEIVHSESCGWMSKKQADFLISLLEIEDDRIDFSRDFWVENYHISRPMRNGNRAWRLIARKY